MNVREHFYDFIQNLQDEICRALEESDGKAKFKEDLWERPGGGGGRTRVIENGNVFEKGGVNISAVHGEVTDAMRKQLKVEGHSFYACGLSLVIHPFNPMIPTVHANFRYFEMYNEKNEIVNCWFGGGADLTPYYVFEEDAIHFHTTLKDACDKHHPSFYPQFKKQCDNYFHNHHRNEARGIGGIFYDYLKSNDEISIEDRLNFVKDTANSFLTAYLPIVKRRKELAYNENEKYWQEIRRGRYVEFNLIHDKGTLFGLKTNGRIESILMSLPATVRWDYDFQPEQGSREMKLLEMLKPKDWVNMKTHKSRT